MGTSSAAILDSQTAKHRSVLPVREVDSDRPGKELPKGSAEGGIACADDDHDRISLTCSLRESQCWAAGRSPEITLKPGNL